MRQIDHLWEPAPTIEKQEEATNASPKTDPAPHFRPRARNQEDAPPEHCGARARPGERAVGLASGTTDPTVDSQTIQLAGSGANVYFVAIPKFAAQTLRKAADLGWRPVKYLNNVSSSVTVTMQPAGFENCEGTITGLFLMDPTDRQWSGNEDMKTWRAFMAKYLPDANAADGRIRAEHDGRFPSDGGSTGVNVLRAKTVLISGAGIAGPALAYWLAAGGFRPTMIEQAPALRTGGYVIDFWGLGYDIAARMGLGADIERIGYKARELRVVDDSGSRIAGFGVNVFRELTAGRYVTLARSDLSRLLSGKIRDTTEVMFSEDVVALHDGSDGVTVEFKRAGRRRFDLVIGADGLHSNIRRLVFGPQSRFEHQLGYIVAAFEVAGYQPRDDDVYVMYNQPGWMAGRFALRNDRTLFLIIFDDDMAIDPAGLPLSGRKAILRNRLARGKWECSAMLAELDRSSELYFDRVSQITMDRWSRGRVALVGDAAFCVSLAAGQGSALAMTSAFVLAGELDRAGGQHEEAFAAYEALLRPYIAAKRRGAARFAAAFAPRTRCGLFLRNQVIKAAALPGVARYTLGAGIVDKLELPDYGRLLHEAPVA